jgi:ABC-type phosphate transport system substrate-binding protein
MTQNCQFRQRDDRKTNENRSEAVVQMVANDPYAIGYSGVG